MITQSILSELKKIVGPEHLLTEREDMLTYSYDAAVLDSQMPCAAVMPGTTQEIGKIVSLAMKIVFPSQFGDRAPTCPGAPFRKLQGLCCSRAG